MRLCLLHTANAGPVFACGPCCDAVIMAAARLGHRLPRIDPVPEGMVPREQACECCGRRDEPRPDTWPGTISVDGVVIGVVKDVEIHWGDER